MKLLRKATVILAFIGFYDSQCIAMEGDEAPIIQNRGGSLGTR
jgi:hypothetical protein